MRVAVIAVDGTFEYKELDFAGCQRAVGGYVQLVRLAAGVWAYVNEDGIGLGLPVNRTATGLVVALGSGLLLDEGIRGPMVVLGRNGAAGITASGKAAVEAACSSAAGGGTCPASA